MDSEEVVMGCDLNPCDTYKRWQKASRKQHEEIERLRAVLQNISDAHDIRAELFLSDTECAASLADRAEAALSGWDARWTLEDAREWAARRKTNAPA